MKEKKLILEQNQRQLQLFRVIAYKISEGQLPEMEIGAYVVRDATSTSENNFKTILDNPAFRKEFWDTYGDKLIAVGAVPSNLVTLGDFEKYYDLEGINLANLSLTEKARYETLKARGYEKVPSVSGTCPTTADYTHEEIKNKNGVVVFCMRKKNVNLSGGYPKAPDEPFYCVKNQKYYNGKFAVRNTMLADTVADRIQIDDTIYFIFMNLDGNAKLKDTQNRERLTGTWKCKNDYSYKVVFPAFTKTDAQGKSISFVGMTIDYGTETKIIKH